MTRAELPRFGHVLAPALAIPRRSRACDAVQMVTEAEWASEALRIAQAIERHGGLPDALRPGFDSAVAMWRQGTVDVGLLTRVKDGFWDYLRGKHGDSTSLTDSEHRAIRAALAITEPPTTDEALSDSLDWVRDMLGNDAL